MIGAVSTDQIPSRPARSVDDRAGQAGESEDVASRARPKDWLGLGLLAVPCMLVSVNSNLLNLALPALSAEFQPSNTQVLWICDVYVLLVAGLLLPVGLLADRFGRRRVLFLGAAVFGLASIGAAVAPDPALLIVCRGLIGVGSAMLAPSTLSLIRSMFHVPDQRAVALGIWTASFALGGILGPLLGGVLIEAVSWRAVFLVTPAAMVILLVLGPFVLPEYRSETFRRIDAIGVAMAIAGLLGAIYAVEQLSAQGSVLVSGSVGVVGIVVLVGFVRRQTRISEPVLDVSLFRERAYTVPLVGNAFAFAVLFGTQLLIGQYLQSVLGMSPLQAGVWTIPSAAAYAAGGLLAPRLGFALGTERLLTFGLAFSAVGFGIVAAIDVTTGLVVFVVGSVVYSLGLAPVYQVTTECTVAALPAEKAGVASATMETATNLGGALGIAVFGSLAGAVYRAGAAGSGIHTQTIGDALTRAENLPEGQADQFLEAVQTAFVQGFRLVEMIGAGLLLIAALATPLLLRQHRAPRGTTPPSSSTTATSSSDSRN
jgi:DHA2 family multidrug resistance protein-like MFS transporter